MVTLNIARTSDQEKAIEHHDSQTRGGHDMSRRTEIIY